MKSLAVYDSDKRLFVENCDTYDINKFVQDACSNLKSVLLSSYLNTNGINLTFSLTDTHFGGKRFWFLCPLCNKRFGKLYRHPLSTVLGCRSCLGLEYSSRIYKD